jgi:hypothetical protein
MLPPFLGALLFLATVGIVSLALLVALWGLIRRDSRLSRRAFLAGGAMASIYAIFWIAGLLLAPHTVLPPGQTVTFCGFDCHLHVSVDSIHRAADLGVTVRFQSNAVQAPEFPAQLAFRLRDAAGREYRPSNSLPDSALRAGQSWTWELHFPAEAQTAGAVLLVSWRGNLDYFVPGAGNPLVQRRRQLALITPSGSSL